MKFAVYNLETGAIRCAGNVPAAEHAMRMCRAGEGVLFGKNVHPATHKVDLSGKAPVFALKAEGEREPAPVTKPQPTISDVVAALQKKGIEISEEDIADAVAERAAVLTNAPKATDEPIQRT